jgi:hypothetical protein
MRFLRIGLLALLSLALAGCSGGGSSSPGPTPTPTATATPTPTPQVTLTTQVVGPGTIASSPSGISCPGTCSAPFTTGSSVTLNATPSAGGTFQTWFDVPCAAASCVLVLQTNAALDALFHCDPVSSGGCVVSDGCRLGVYRSTDTATCSTAGAGVQGTVCTADTDCARTFGCVDLGMTKKCVRYCVVGGAPCGATLTCTAFATPFVIDGTEYGACL